MKVKNGLSFSDEQPKDLRFALVTACAFFCVNLFFALRHVMWRDEWMPLTVARFTSGYGEFFEHIKFTGRIVFFSLCWLLEFADGNLVLFKASIVLFSSVGVFVLCRYSPLSRWQKILFAFGYYPLYEYGTILRDYSVIGALSICCCALLNSERWRPLVFSFVVALLLETNPFGLALACALGATFVFDAWQEGRLGPEIFGSLPAVGGGVLVVCSFLAALKTMIPPPEIAEIVLGQALRQDSHFVRLIESLPFPLRGWLPIPLFGTWNSQILDPWPGVQIFLTLSLIVLVTTILWPNKKALFLFMIGMLGLGSILCHLPWTALRYHGSYFLLLVLAYWTLRCDVNEGGGFSSRFGAVAWLRRHASALMTAMLTVHVVVAGAFLLQEQVIPFSGSRDAAEIIRKYAPPDAPIIGDPDYLMISLSGYLGREVYIASRDEMGSFTKVDHKRRSTILSSDELARVVGEQFQKHGRDVVLLTGYEIGLPPEMGKLLGATHSISGENYFVYLLNARRGTP
ncbi:MAG: hypothetical protein EBV83_00175 [Verrucomicrobia bacterium]|nr:hypothetical protein [Verrucomicrobiota bacterium]